MRYKSPEQKKNILIYINHYFRDNHHSPTQREIAKAVGIAPSSAYRYITEMVKEDMVSYDGEKVVTSETKKCAVDYVSLPITDSIQCTDPENEPEQVESYVSLPTYVFGDEESYLLRANDSTMADYGISPGDLVVIQKQDTAKRGDIILAQDDKNQNTLKWFAGVDPSSGLAVLVYRNKKEYPRKYMLIKDLVIYGVVKYVIHSYIAL